MKILAGLEYILRKAQVGWGYKYVVKSDFVCNIFSCVYVKINSFYIYACVCYCVVHRTGRRMQRRTCLCAPSWRPSLSSSWTGGGRSSGTYMYMYICDRVRGNRAFVDF